MAAIGEKTDTIQNSTQIKPRVLSGIQSTGTLTIGNYVGAISLWVEQQYDYTNYIFVADLHSLTIPEKVNPAELRAKSREIAALYVACGIDPDEAIIFLQSDVPAHPYLGWVLGCCTPIGWLQRMTQFKIKSGRTETVSAGLFTYPVLQAADILMYQADFVPVGDDQSQHVELTRDIAQRFNHLYGDYFNVPKLLTRKSGARIMALDDPTAKMSKSIAATQDRHAIRLLDDPKTIRKAIMSAVTDSGKETRFDHASPGVLNLLTITEILTGDTRESIEAEFEGKGYGHLKRTVADIVIETLAPIQQKYRQITDDPTYMDNLLTTGAEKASLIANKTVQEVRQLVGV
jgi:tryptophanyl-tRNA synthetase